MRIPLVLLTLAASSEPVAKPILTATCDAPVGSRFDQVDGAVKENRDDFTGVDPVFILDDQKPGKLLLVFGATKPAQDAGLQTQAEEAIVVSMSNDKITAIEVSAPVVEMFSLYPTKGVMFYTKHGIESSLGLGPFTATFHAQCKFAR